MAVLLAGPPEETEPLLVLLLDRTELEPGDFAELEVRPPPEALRGSMVTSLAPLILRGLLRVLIFRCLEVRRARALASKRSAFFGR